VNQPDLLLADEPTGDLDERSAENIFELMQRLHESHHLTSIVATHNLMLARRTDRVLNLEHGNLTPYLEVPAEVAYQGRPAGTGAKTPGERG
jgi:lipoprotein-releasing system ATP-binding protein